MKTRLRFTKTGSIRFIGHLDLMRFFQKALRRAEMDVSYSKGYSPHQLMSFASPLSVGSTTDGDYIDVSFESLPDMPKEKLIEHINHSMTDEVFITDMILLPDYAKTSMSLLYCCDYKIGFREGVAIPDHLHDKLIDYFEQNNIQIEKKTKKSTKIIDVRPHIHHYAFSIDEFTKATNTQYPSLHCDLPEDERCVYLQLSAGSDMNIKPGLILDDFMQKHGFSTDLLTYQIHRLDMYFHESKKPQEQ